nr:type 1 glutamine amidotransferase [Roseospira visakhapatnamensis]
MPPATVPADLPLAPRVAPRVARLEGPPLRLLIVEGNTIDARRAVEASGGTVACVLYEQVLLALAPAGSTCATICPGDPDGDTLPAGLDWAQIDGVASTGSALSVYWDRPEVHRQIAFHARVFDSGRPAFGSCWALQVAAVVAGGTVAANPRGREVGLARKVTLTEAGRAHPLHDGRPPAFDAVAIHGDEVTRPPAGMTCLSGNAVSPVQAADIRHGNGMFWGVQYHPEFSLRDIGPLCRRYREQLIADGLAADTAAVARHAEVLETLGADPGRRDLAWRLGIDHDVLDDARRLTEIRNWLVHQVLPA